MSAEFFETIKRGDSDGVIRQLAASPELAEAEDGGVTAVLVAAYWRKNEIALLIARSKRELSIFEAAAIGDTDRVRAHLDRDPALSIAFAPDGFQPLGLAAFFGHADVARLLLERGADPSTPSRNEMGVTPLASALAAGHDRIARALVEAGADVRAKQRHGWTPLHAAAEHGSTEMVTLLLAHRADPSARNDVGMSAADYARSKGNEELARLIEARISN